MKITNNTRNLVKKIFAVVNINILPKTKETIVSVNNISPKFRKKIDNFRGEGRPFPVEISDIKLN